MKRRSSSAAPGKFHTTVNAYHLPFGRCRSHAKQETPGSAPPLNPDAGINRYRAKVLLHDGRAIYSDIIPVYVGGTNGIRIFPNPFTSNGILHVVVNSPGENALFQLFDIAGREIWSSLLTEIHTPIQLPEMQAGTYFWRMGEARGKLVATRTN